MIAIIGDSEFNSETIKIEIKLSDREKLEISKMPIEHDTYKSEPGGTNAQESDIIEIAPPVPRRKVL